MVWEVDTLRQALHISRASIGLCAHLEGRDKVEAGSIVIELTEFMP